MGSPSLVNMMGFITNGNKYPYMFAKNRKKGIVTTESLVGYSKYTSRKKANEIDKELMDRVPGGYYKYSSERKGSTRTLTNEGWIKNHEEMKKFRNYVASHWQEKGKHAWLPIQSFKDYETASQHGLFEDEDYGVIVKNTLSKFFKYVGFEEDNMIWWMNYHNNKNHPHVHLAFIEKTTTRTKGTFSQNELKQFKRYMLTEMKERERLLIGTDVAFKNHMKELQQDKLLMQDKGKVLIVKRQDAEINELIYRLKLKLPKTGRLSYGSSHMIPYREEIDVIVEKVLNHENVKDAYEKLIHSYEELDEVYSKELHDKVTNLKDSEVDKIHKVIANSILNSIKNEKEGEYPHITVNIEAPDLKKDGSSYTKDIIFANKDAYEKEDVMGNNNFTYVEMSDSKNYGSIYTKGSYFTSSGSNYIDAALSAIKRSSAEIDREVRQGLEDYLNEGKTKEGKKNGKVL